MNLTPTEMERLTIYTAAEFARRHKRLGIRLSRPEAVALITDEMLLAARAGKAYEEIVDMAGRLLTADDVLPGVAAMIDHIMAEGNFEEGTKMMVVFKPIAPGVDGPDNSPAPGEILSPEGSIELLAGRQRTEIEVINTGDRDIQVRSHTHFFEVNRALDFDRRAAFGKKLDTASGAGMRFEPGIRKTVTLVPIGGDARVMGEAGLVNGSVSSDAACEDALARARAAGYLGA